MSKTLTLVLNIGTKDAQALGLKETLAGKTVTVDDKVADELLSRAWATEAGKTTLDRSARPHSSAEAAPGEGQPIEGADAEDVDLDTLTKAELVAHAEKIGVEGITQSMSKAEMIQAIEEGLA